MTHRNITPLALCAALCLAGCEESTFGVTGEDGDAAMEATGDEAADGAGETPGEVPGEVPGELPGDTPVEEAPGETVDPCAGVDCGGHGDCSSATGSAVCACDGGWKPQGLTCVEACTGVACGVGAHCAAGSCVCNDGYEGNPVAGCTPVSTQEEQVRAGLVTIAQAELGYCEGVDDRPYMQMQPGFWCYDFVAWVYEQSSYPLPAPLGLSQYPAGSLPTGWKPEAGDLIKFTIQHYGMVKESNADGSVITTIEGNYGSCVVSRTTGIGDIEYFGTLDDAF